MLSGSSVDLRRSIYAEWFMRDVTLAIGVPNCKSNIPGRARAGALRHIHAGTDCHGPQLDRGAEALSNDIKPVIVRRPLSMWQDRRLGLAHQRGDLMQALYFEGKGQLAWRDDQAIPLAGDDQAIVRPIAATTCDLDRGIIDGLCSFLRVSRSATRRSRKSSRSGTVCAPSCPATSWWCLGSPRVERAISAAPASRPAAKPWVSGPPMGCPMAAARGQGRRRSVFRPGLDSVRGRDAGQGAG